MSALALQGQVLDPHGRPYVYMGGMAQQMLGQDSPYSGAATGNRLGALWGASSGSADADLVWSRETLRDRGMDQVRNNPIARSTLVTLDSNVIGTGLILNSDIDHEVLGISQDEATAIGNRAQTIFQLWAESKESDSRQQLNFFQQQRLAYWSSRDAGDVLALMVGFSRGDFPFRSRLQLVESHQVSTPADQTENTNLSMGVEKDRNGAPLRYHVRRAHPGDIFRSSSTDAFIWDSVPAAGRRTGRKIAWLVYSIKRPGQSRGVPYITVALASLKQLERYTQSELMASIIGGTVTMVVTTPGTPNIGTIISTPLGRDTGRPSQGAADYALDYGATLFLKPSESFETIAPNRPNQAFADFIRANVEQIGAGLGIPVEVLLKRFSTSFSAATAAKQEAGKVFLQERKEFATDFCQPVYETVIREAVLNGMIDMPGFLENPLFRQAYLRATWQGPAFGIMRPLEDVKAAVAKIEARLSSRTLEIPRLTGHSREEIDRQLQNEAASAIAGEA